MVARFPPPPATDTESQDCNFYSVLVSTRGGHFSATGDKRYFIVKNSLQEDMGILGENTNTCSNLRCAGNCGNYHGALGDTWSVLPLQHPVKIGTVDRHAVYSPAIIALLSWSDEQQERREELDRMHVQQMQLAVQAAQASATREDERKIRLRAARDSCIQQAMSSQGFNQFGRVSVAYQGRPLALLPPPPPRISAVEIGSLGQNHGAPTIKITPGRAKA